MGSNQYISELIASLPPSDRVDSLPLEWCSYLPSAFPAGTSILSLYFSFFWLSFWSLIVVILHDFYFLRTSVKHFLPASYFSAPNSLILFHVRVQNLEHVLGSGNPLLRCLGGAFAQGPRLSLRWCSLSSGAHSSLLRGEGLCQVLPGRLIS